MLNNAQFLTVIKESFETYLQVGTSRSTAKLKTLHGHIANDLQETFGKDFRILSQGYGNGKEASINGRYYPKNVDITVSHQGIPVAGYGVKFVMRNYSQNSNNYFENMLGETANLRSNQVPYFQVFIIFDKVPYYKKGGEFSRYDVITEHNMEKYIKLSMDNPDSFLHSPDKTLICVVHLKEKSNNYSFKNDKEYADYYRSVIGSSDLITYSNKIQDNFGNGVVLNDYEKFLSKTKNIVIGKMK